jgi:hypothetical protein
MTKLFHLDHSLIVDADPVTRSWVTRNRKLDRTLFVALWTNADDAPVML